MSSGVRKSDVESSSSSISARSREVDLEERRVAP